MLQNGPSKYFVSGKNQEKHKCATLEAAGFADELDEIQSLETSKNMSTESWNFWPTKFVQGVCKDYGEQHSPRSLCTICCGLQRHLEVWKRTMEVTLLNC